MSRIDGLIINESVILFSDQILNKLKSVIIHSTFIEYGIVDVKNRWFYHVRRVISSISVVQLEKKI